MSSFKKWWNKQNDITLKMATPEVIAKAAWGKSDEEIKRLREGLEKIESFGHSNKGCGAGYTCATMAESILDFHKYSEG